MPQRVVVITGGARGIGRAIVERCCEEDCRVYSLDITHEPSTPSHASCVELHCDVTDEHSIDKAICVIKERDDVVDGLVNCAGVNAFADPAMMAVDEWDRFFALDLRASWLTCRASLPMLRRSEGPSVVNVSSIHAKLTLPGMFPYASAKAGLEGLTRSLALEWGALGIRVNSVAPGFTRTQLVLDWLAKQEDPVAAVDRVNEMVALGRMMEPKEVANAIWFLLHPDSSGITGSVVPVDGGHSIRFVG